MNKTPWAINMPNSKSRFYLCVCFSNGTEVGLPHPYEIQEYPLFFISENDWFSQPQSKLSTKQKHGWVKKWHFLLYFLIQLFV